MEKWQYIEGIFEKEDRETMNNMALEEVAHNIFGNIVLCPPVKDGMIKFEIKDKFKTIDGKISFAAVVSLQQKEYYDKVLRLKLFKRNEENNRYASFLLEDISLNNELEKSTLISSIVNIASDESLGDGFPKRNNFTFNFEDIPVLGIGKYAIALVLEEGKTFESIASFYFEVVE